MTKQVRGYLTQDGAFFENKKDAQLYDLRQALQKAFTPRWSLQEKEDWTFDTLLRFIETNSETIQGYTKLYMEKFHDEHASVSSEDKTETEVTKKTD